MKRATVLIDEELVKVGLQVTGLKTRNNLIDYALRELLQRQGQARLLDLQRKMSLETDAFDTSA